MFDFFKTFEISKAAFRLSENIQQYSRESLEISQLAATESMIDKDKRSKAKALRKSIEAVARAGKKIFKHNSPPSTTNEQSPLSSETIQYLEIIDAHLKQFISSNSNNKRKLTEKTDPPDEQENSPMNDENRQYRDFRIAEQKRKKIPSWDSNTQPCDLSKFLDFESEKGGDPPAALRMLYR